MRKLIIILGVCALAIGARAQYGSGNGSYGTIGLGAAAVALIGQSIRSIARTSFGLVLLIAIIPGGPDCW